MKPDWDKLADSFAGSDKVLIADVDCTAAGESLCKKHDVKGYPTIKSFSAGDYENGESYEGGRDFASLKGHAESLGPACTASSLENCTEEQKAALEKYMKMSPERRCAHATPLPTRPCRLAPGFPASPPPARLPATLTAPRPLATSGKKHHGTCAPVAARGRQSRRTPTHVL